MISVKSMHKHKCSDFGDTKAVKISIVINRGELRQGRQIRVNNLLLLVIYSVGSIPNTTACLNNSQPAVPVAITTKFALL